MTVHAKKPEYTDRKSRTGSDESADFAPDDTSNGHAAERPATLALLSRLALEEEDLDRLMAKSVHHIAAALDVEYCMILVLAQDADVCTLKAGVGWTADHVGSTTIAADVDSLIAYTLAAREPVIIENLHSEQRFGQPSLFEERDIVGGITAAIRTHDRPYGILGVYTTEGEVLDDGSAYFVQAVANVLAGAVQRCCTEQGLERASAEFEARVAERTRELTAANDRLRDEIERRKRAQERFARAFHANPAGCVLQELPTLRYLDVNARFEELTGYHRDEFPGRTSEDMGILVDQDKRDDALRRILEGRPSELDVYQFRTRAGEVREVLAKGEPIEVDGTSCVLWMMVDVTDFQRAERRFFTVFRLAPVAASISSLDDGRFIAVNDRYTEITGYAREEVVGRTSVELGFVDAENRERLVQQILSEGGYNNLEAKFRTKSGELRDISAMTTLIELEGEQAILGFFHDITERKRLEAELEAHRERLQLLVDDRTAELAAKNEALAREVAEHKRTAAQLRRLNEELEVRVAERTEAVHTLASDLTLAEQRERHRIAQILHDDIQQLLHALRTQMAILREVLPDEQPTVLAKMDAVTKQAIRATRTLVVNLSPPVLEGENLADALEWLARQMRELHGLTVTIEVEDESRALSEEMRVLLFQIVRELLFNVVKHADVNDAAIHITRATRQLRIVVLDNGRGFDISTLPDSKDPHTGLGLRRARERLRLFGGRLEIVSAPDAGTRVTITVPWPVDGSSGADPDTGT